MKTGNGGINAVVTRELSTNGCDGQKAKSFEMDNIIDAAFEMICWLKENKKL